MTKDVIFWMSTLSAGSTALAGFLLAYPGNLVPQVVLLVVGALAFTLQAMVAFATKPKDN